MKSVGRNIALLAGGVVVALAFAAGPANAQKPTPEQLAALRTNCKADLAKLCPGVPADGRALLCLRQNISRATPACQTAVNAVK